MPAYLVFEYYDLERRDFDKSTIWQFFIVIQGAYINFLSYRQKLQSNHCVSVNVNMQTA